MGDGGSAVNCSASVVTTTLFPFQKKGPGWKAPQVLNGGWRIHPVHLNYTAALTDTLEEPEEED